MKKLYLVLGLIISGLVWAGSNLPPPALGKGKTPKADKESKGNLPELKLITHLPEEKVYQGKIFSFQVELSWEQEEGVCELEFKVPQPPTGEGLKPVGAELETKTLLDKGKTFSQRSYRFRYLAEKSGRISLAPGYLEYSCLGEENWHKLDIPGAGIEVYEARFDFSGFFKSWQFRVILAGAFLFGLGIFLWLYFREREARKPPPEPVKSPEEQAKALLAQADQYRIAGRYTHYFLGLEQALREYLKEKYSLSWSGRERLREELSWRFGEEIAGEVERFLELSDRVKFAGYEPGSLELDRAYQTILQILEQGKSLNSGGEQ